jgi:hypothetical protein
MEWIIESYDRRTDRDGENRFPTESTFIRAAEDLLGNAGKGLCPQPFPMAQSSKTNGRCGL